MNPHLYAEELEALKADRETQLDKETDGTYNHGWVSGEIRGIEKSIERIQNMNADKRKGYEISNEDYTFYFLATSSEEAKQLFLEEYEDEDTDEDIKEKLSKIVEMKELDDDDIVYSPDGEPFSVSKAKRLEDFQDSYMFGYR